VGGGCEPWDCTNIAIDLTNWDPESGEPVPEACGLVQDPCTGQFIDCGGCSLYGYECGIGKRDDSSMIPGEAIPNICASACYVVEAQTPGCGTWSDPYFSWSCDTSASPETNESPCGADDPYGQFGGSHCCELSTYTKP
jgi:hypothetical protein